MATINFFAAGGLDELGKNMYVFEVNEKIFIFECGVKAPLSGRLGIDTVIPQFDYFIQNKDKIAGIFISSGQSQLMGALPFLFKKLAVNIYCSSITAFLVKNTLEKMKMGDYAQYIKIINPKQQIKFSDDEVSVEPFSVTGSLPGAYGYIISTVDGNFVYISDFLFETNDIIARNLDMRHLAKKVSHKKTLAFLTGSQNAAKKTFTAPNHTISKYMEQPFVDAQDRIVVFAYNEMIYNILEIIALANFYNKFIAIPDWTCYQLILSLKNTNKIVKEARFINLIKVKPEQEKDLVVIITDSWDNLYQNMAQIGLGNDNSIRIQATDTILVTSVPQPGTERQAAASLDEVAKNDPKIVLVPRKQHYLLYPSAEDIKLMADIVEPQVFIPIKGLYKNMLAAAQLFEEDAYPKTLLLNNGDLITFKDGVLLKRRLKVEASKDVMVDAGGTHNVGVEIIREREMLSRDGVVVIGMMLDRKDNHQLVGAIDIQMRGVVYVDESTQELFDILKNIIGTMIDDYTLNLKETKERFNNREITNSIRRKITRVIMKNTKKTPMVIPVIIEV